jgi:tRNA pseudouridine55 synthase
MKTHAGAKEILDFDEGEIILVNKPIDWTSFDVVARIRSFYGIKKIGHAGTLDPKATGLLILCTGRMTKQISEFQDFEKEYTGIMEIGAVTKSFDSETEVIDKKEFNHISPELIRDTFQTFIGIQQQLPPMYSAIKKGGRRLYKDARKGRDIQRETREVNIKEFEMTSFHPPEVGFRVVCSKGTYIRALADDAGKKLGCGAYLKTLVRTRIGPYLLNDAMTMEEIHMLGGKIRRETI